MSAKGSKEIARRAVDALNQEDWAEQVLEFSTPEDAEIFVQQHTQFLTAFPDYQFTIDDMIAEGDKVAVRGTVRATHEGEYPVAELKGVAPTGRRLEWEEAWFWRIVEGKIVEGWSVIDGVARLQQLGILPSPDP